MVVNFEQSTIRRRSSDRVRSNGLAQPCQLLQSFTFETTDKLGPINQFSQITDVVLFDEPARLSPGPPELILHILLCDFLVMHASHFLLQLNLLRLS